MNNLLKDASYKQMKSNPTTKVEKKVAGALKEVGSRGGLSSAQRKSLVNNYSIHHSCTAYPRFTGKACTSNQLSLSLTH